jgi:hypothetical protein
MKINKPSSVYTAIYIQSDRKVHMRHHERRWLRIILDNFVLPIVSQLGTSFKKKHQHLSLFLFARGVTTIVLVGGQGVADQDNVYLSYS